MRGHSAAGADAAAADDLPILRGAACDKVDLGADSVAVARDADQTNLEPVVGIAVRETESEILAAVEAGVAGYALQEHSLDELVRVIQSVIRDEAICSPRMAACMMHRLSHLASERRHDGPAGRLTVRERQVASLVASGMTNKEIARRLSIQLSTVKNHVHNILEKLQLRRRGQAIVLLSRWESPKGT